MTRQRRRAAARTLAHELAHVVRLPRLAYWLTMLRMARHLRRFA